MRTTILLALCLVILTACGNDDVRRQADENKKIGVLLVNHGSNSENWRNMLLDVEEAVENKILENKQVGDVRTAFMEYTEPSIATRLKEFDEDGYDEVVVVPIFLTVSSHYSHDIPVICGVSTDPNKVEELKEEGIEVYKPKAKINIAPPLDYTNILKKNVERRVLALSKNPENESVLLVAYGDADYNQQWEEMVAEIGKYLKSKTGHQNIAYAWCGHLVHYSKDPTKNGIKQLQEFTEDVIVIPVLVANDPYFQRDIIQKAVDEEDNGGNVKYIQDAILPDPGLNEWVIDITKKTIEGL